MLDHWEGIVTTELPLDSHISLSETRNIAIRRLKLSAAEQAGAYVIRTNTLMKDEVSESIEIISASVVSLSNVSEQIDISTFPNVFSISGLAKVDLSTVKDRLHYVMENKELREELSRLGNAYSQALKAKSHLVDYSLITDKEKSLIRLISGIEREMLMAQSRNELDDAKMEIVEGIVKEIREKGEISAKLVAIKDQGSHLDYYVRVTFSAPLNEINAIASAVWETRLRSDEDHPYVLINGRKLSSHRFSHEDASELLRTLSKKEVSIRIGVNHHYHDIPIVYSGNAFRPGCRVNMPESGAMTLCITNINGSSSATLNTATYLNPAIISVPKSEERKHIGDIVSATLVYDGMKY